MIYSQQFPLPLWYKRKQQDHSAGETTAAFHQSLHAAAMKTQQIYQLSTIVTVQLCRHHWAGDIYLWRLHCTAWL